MQDYSRMNQDAHRGNHLCVTTSLYTELIWIKPGRSRLILNNIRDSLLSMHMRASARQY